MKNKPSKILSIHSIKDLDKITNDTKYINLDITNPNHDIIAYFMEYGENYMYSDIISDVMGYTYVNYDKFSKAENIIDMIYVNMPSNLTKLEMAKYLYISLAKCISSDINANQNKSEIYNLTLMSTINNLWGSLSEGTVTDISASKLYYYLCRRLDIDINIFVDEDNKHALTKLMIGKQTLVTDIYEDIPFIWCNMQTRHFATYNDDQVLDKRIRYLKNKYHDYYIDKALKDIDYTKPECVYTILDRTSDLIDVNSIKPVELSIIYSYLFNKYCPNYNIKINNLYLNDEHKNHFIMISYNDQHYSYNYKQKNFVSIEDAEIIDNLNLGKIGLYKDEFIPNINNCL